MAKVSIHCDGTDIYIVPEEKKAKHNDSSHKEEADFKEQELSGGYSLGDVGTNGNGASGKKAAESIEYHPLFPYELKSVKKNGNGKSNGNGNGDGNGVLILEKAIATNHVQLEEATTEAEEKHRTIVDQIPDAYFAIDPVGNFIFVNDTLCRFLGYSKEELTGTACRDHITEECYEAVYKAFDDAFQSRTEVKDLHCQVIRKDGTTAIAEMSADLLKNGYGEVVGFRCIGRDVTERVKQEEALKQSVERYRAVMEEIDESYFEVDLSGNFTYVNEAACRQLRRSKEELVGMNYRCYIPEDEIDSVYQAWNKVYRTGEPLTSYHHANVKNCGQKLYLEDSISPVRNIEGKIIGFRSICRNATERKRVTQKLVELKWPAMTS
jgi:PAS domain S-box-containing protein